MVDRRRERRSRAELRVQVSGLDASCEEFSERVVATNLSRSGALLKNVDIELRCGEVIAIEYAHRQAYFRIVWVLNSGMPEGMQVAVHKLAKSPGPWEEVLPLEEAIADLAGTRQE